MKMNFLWVSFLIMLINSPIYACDIVNKKELSSAKRIGVAGDCSNNGEKIECYEEGAYYGGFICDGPEGTNSSYNLKDLIYSVCGCSPQDQERLDDQMHRELE